MRAPRSMWWRQYKRKLRIWETNFGRDAGWVIERDGKPVAVLTEPRFDDMFWDSYRLEVVAEDPELRQRMLTKEFWLGNEWVGMVWRNRDFGDEPEFALPSGEPFREPGRLSMRGLYLRIGWPCPWDWMVLWMRRVAQEPRPLRRDRRISNSYNSSRTPVDGRGRSCR